MRKRKLVGRIYGMKYSWKHHKDRNRRKNRIKRSGQARWVYISDINRNIPTTWRWARGDSEPKSHWISEQLYKDNTAGRFRSKQPRHRQQLNRFNGILGSSSKTRGCGGVEIGALDSPRSRSDPRSLINMISLLVSVKSLPWKRKLRFPRILRTLSSKPFFLNLLPAFPVHSTSFFYQSTSNMK